MGKVDWVVVALKSSSLDAIPPLIEPLLTPSTRVLTIMNGLIEDDLVKGLKKYMEDPSEEGRISCCAALYGGMAYICSNRLAPGLVDHSFGGPLSGGLAISRDDGEDHKSPLERLWLDTQVKFTYEDSLLRGRWNKNIWNLPMNGISVAMGGITTDNIVNDPGLRQLACTIMDEAILIANADLQRHGVDASQHFSDKDRDYMMELSDGVGAYRTSTMVDLMERRPMEVKYLFRKAIDRADELGVPVPHLETVVLQIEGFQRMYGLY
jgi:2-dehydropantoate 2-reductase